MLDDDEIIETRFEPGSLTDREAFPRLVGNMFSSWPVRGFRIAHGLEGGDRPVLLLSWEFHGEESPMVLALSYELAKGLQQAIAEFLKEP